MGVEVKSMMFFSIYMRSIVRKKNINVFSYEKEIGPYDRFTFNMLLSTEFKAGNFFKQYLAELVSNIVENDIELSAECIRYGERFISQPYETLREICGEDYKGKSRDEIDTAIWTTQIKLIFPLTETFRRDFIKRKEKLIRAGLPCQTGFGETVYEPKEAEIGLLYFLNARDRWPLHQHEYEQLYLYHEIRNKLAHMGTLSYEQLKQLNL